MKKKTNAQIIWGFLQGSLRFFIILIVANGIRTLCEMLTPQIVRAAIDNALGGVEPDFPDFVMNIVNKFGGFAYLGEHLWIMAVAVIIVTVVQAVFGYIGIVHNTKAAESFSKNMRDQLFEHIQLLPYEWHMKNHTGDIIQRCTSDVQTVRNFIAEQLTSLVLVIIKLVMGLYFMFSMNVELSLYSLIPIPFIMIFTIKFSKDMHDGFKKCDEMEGVVSGMIQENLSGVRVVRAFGQERKERDRFLAKNEEYTKLWYGMGHIMGRFWSTQDLLTGIQTLFVLVIGVVFCINGKLHPGEYVSFLTYNAMLANPIRRIGRVISEMSKSSVSIDRIAYIMNSEPEQDDPSAAEVPMDKDIVFDHVNFAYDGAAGTLKDVSFEIPAGSTLGILGGTGSGKSTLMLLLDKMYRLPADCGKITIGGVDINKIKTDYLRKNISMVLQEPHLYSRTIAENIKITDDSMSMEEIKEASKAACLDETVESFAKGYDTFVGEKGVTLSGGQKQRTAIARALTRKAPIFVFDDSLSAVDTETDAKIRTALEERFGKATTIIISHRITTLSKADKILVLDNGQIKEFGTPEELKSTGGLYSQIYDIQSGNA